MCNFILGETDRERERLSDTKSGERERELNIFRDTVGRKKTCRLSNSLKRGGNRGQNSRF